MKINKHTFIFLFFIFVSDVHATTTLSCVDATNSKYEMTVVFDEVSKVVITPRNAKSLVTNDEIIFEEVTAEYFYSTRIYRATGRYTVFSKNRVTPSDTNNFYGFCTKKTANKF